MPAVVLILASGRAERFRASGGTVHKLDAVLGDCTVLEHTVAAARSSGLPWHLERAAHPGMGDCIAAAVRATAQADGWLILPGDLPLVQPQTLRLVADTLAAAGPGRHAVTPLYHGRRGHPVGFSAACGAALQTLQGDRGAAPVLRDCQVITLDTTDEGCVLDVDTVDLLADAQRVWTQRSAASGASGATTATATTP